MGHFYDYPVLFLVSLGFDQIYLPSPTVKIHYPYQNSNIDWTRDNKSKFLIASSACKTL